MRYRIEYLGGYGPNRDEGREEWRIWGFAESMAQALLDSIEAECQGLPSRIGRVGTGHA